MARRTDKQTKPTPSELGRRCEPLRQNAPTVETGWQLIKGFGGVGHLNPSWVTLLLLEVPLFSSLLQGGRPSGGRV